MRHVIITALFFIISLSLIGQVRVKDNNFGIGTTTPSEKLHVEGGVKIGNTSTQTAGTIRFNGTCFEGFTGATWVPLGACSGVTPTCTDGIMNGDETGIDCGGATCPTCPTCFDGVQNQDETGIDCGGTFCPSCPTCSDGIMNGDETGIDCGGSTCAPCATGPYDIVWTEMTGTSATGNDLTKTAGTSWNNATAFSANELPANTDGWVEYTIESDMAAINFGMSPVTESGTRWNDTHWAHYSYFNNFNKNQKIEKSTGQHRDIGTVEQYYSIGDKVRVERVGTSIRYLLNGTLLNTSTYPSSSALRAHATMYYNGRIVLDAIASFPVPSSVKTEDPQHKQALAKKKAVCSDEVDVLNTKLNELQSRLNSLVIQDFDSSFVQDYIIEVDLSNRQISLSQNIPNPFDNQTRIYVGLPEIFDQAMLEIIDQRGVILKEINLVDNADGEILLNTNDLTPGVYSYRLKVDGKYIETKTMIKSR